MCFDGDSFVFKFQTIHFTITIMVLLTAFTENMFRLFDTVIIFIFSFYDQLRYFHDRHKFCLYILLTQILCISKRSSHCNLNQLIKLSCLRLTATKIEIYGVYLREVRVFLQHKLWQRRSQRLFLCFTKYKPNTDPCRRSKPCNLFFAFQINSDSKK